MTLAVALVLFAAGLAAWPVLSPADRRLARLGRAARVRVGAATVRVAGPDRARVHAVVLVGAAAVTGGLAGGSALGVAAGSAAGAVAVVVLSARSARREATRRSSLLTALAVLRGELDAGAPFPEAVTVARERAGPAAAAFDLGGADPGGADPGGADADPSGGSRPDVVVRARRGLTAGAGLVAVTGAPWSAVAAGIGRDVAAHDARDREVAAALAGARASTVVLGGLPVLGLGLGAALGADPVGFLLGTPAGQWVLAAGAVLDLLGVVFSTGVAGRAAR